MDEPSLPAGAFKATCLKLMDEVSATGGSVTITKRGKIVARLVAASEPKTGARAFFGALAHCTRVKGDIVSPTAFVDDPVMKHKRIEVGELPVSRKRPASPARRKQRST